MTFSTGVVLGIDIGTTSAKAVARATSQRGTPYVELLTPWRTHGCGQTEIDPYRLVAVAAELIGRVVEAAESAWGPVRVCGIGVTGLAESGVLLDAAGRTGDRLVRSPRRERDQAGEQGSPGICRPVRAHDWSSLV